jgi:uncharacterized protein YkwD
VNEVPQEKSSLNRRDFITAFNAGLVTMGLSTPILQSCKREVAEELFPPKVVEQIFQNLTKLAVLINDYREKKDLIKIPISSKLTTVALVHVMDLAKYHPEKNCNGNLHSWSSHGNWKGGCYVSNDQATYPIMWNKSKEIVGYSDYGYEIAHYGSLNAAAVLDSWKKSSDHNAVILNQGVWSGFPWKALGAALLEGYACAWFGTVPG